MASKIPVGGGNFEVPTLLLKYGPMIMNAPGIYDTI